MTTLWTVVTHIACLFFAPLLSGLLLLVVAIPLGLVSAQLRKWVVRRWPSVAVDPNAYVQGQPPHVVWRAITILDQSSFAAYGFVLPALSYLIFKIASRQLGWTMIAILAISEWTHVSGRIRSFGNPNFKTVEGWRRYMTMFGLVAGTWFAVSQGWIK